MTLQIFPAYEALSQAAAAAIAAVVRQKPEAVLCLASGHTPEGTFRHLVKMAADGDPDFSRCIFIGLDEWVGIAPYNPGSCYFFVHENLFKPLGIQPERIHFFNSLAPDLLAECQRIDDVVARLGGLDLILVGVGLNGHIAMNEPGTPWNLYSHVIALHETTITVGQKYFEQQTPLNKGITVGLRYVQEAKQAILIASGRKKADILRQALEEPPTEQLPASIFQQIPDGRVLLDEDAAAELAALNL
ncbi:MAG: glucosamine-6-phosphate deaminase [Cytophagaceae bacterium]|nr:glucosamine-6-phosphate deaminase [Cytophagaceae bacterium]